MGSERILISFLRAKNPNSKISKNTSEFLCSKLDRDEDEGHIRNISLLSSGQKKKLKAEEANSLLKLLLKAIIVNDDLDESISTDIEEIVIITASETEHGSNDSGDEADSENEANNTMKNFPIHADPLTQSTSDKGPKIPYTV